MFLLLNNTANGGGLVDVLSNLSPGEAFVLFVIVALGGGNFGFSWLNAQRSKNTYVQTVPNHGSSLRDAIDKISVIVEEMRHGLEHDRKTTEQYRDQLESRLNVLECRRKRK